jgi:hypothetical protein
MSGAEKLIAVSPDGEVFQILNPKSYNMKRSGILPLLGLIVSIPSLAQYSAVQFSVGYGFPSASRRLETSYSSTATGSTETGVFGSYGSGVTITGSFTRMFNDNIGIDVAANYLIGKEYDGTSSSGSTGFSFSSSNTTSAKGLFFSPALVIEASGDKIKPYVKAGFVLGFMSITRTSDNKSVAGGITQTSHLKGELTGGPPFGFRGGIGISTGGSGKTKFFSEIIFTSMSYYPAKGELVESSVNGVDQLTSLPVSSKQTNFVDSISNNFASPPNPNEPSESIAESFPMGSISINVGIRFMLK